MVRIYLPITFGAHPPLPLPCLRVCVLLGKKEKEKERERGEREFVLLPELFPILSSSLLFFELIFFPHSTTTLLIESGVGTETGYSTERERDAFV